MGEHDFFSLSFSLFFLLLFFFSPENFRRVVTLPFVISIAAHPRETSSIDYFSILAEYVPVSSLSLSLSLSISIHLWTNRGKPPESLFRESLEESTHVSTGRIAQLNARRLSKSGQSGVGRI